MKKKTHGKIQIIFISFQLFDMKLFIKLKNIFMKILGFLIDLI